MDDFAENKKQNNVILCDIFKNLHLVMLQACKFG